ncbi:MAG: globin family protein [Alphaproteobacteria bacterium]|nr:globin family protein [Alphaproteobacteria bacterium]
MTPQDLYLVQSSWEKVRPISAQAAELFYARLFSTAPELKGLFKGDMREQGQRLMDMIDTAVNGLETWDQLVPAVQELGKRHAGYGVKDADYDAVAAALLWTLDTGLGDAFTDEVERAWIRTYTALADAMKSAAAEGAAA